MEPPSRHLGANKRDPFGDIDGTHQQNTREQSQQSSDVIDSPEFHNQANPAANFTSETMANEANDEEEWMAFINWELTAPDWEFPEPTTPTPTADNENDNESGTNVVTDATGELSPESTKPFQLSEKEKEKANPPKWDDVKKPHVKTDPFMGVTGEMMRSDPELVNFKKFSHRINGKEKEAKAFNERVLSALQSASPERLHEIEEFTPAQREEIQKRFHAWKRQRMAGNSGE